MKQISDEMIERVSNLARLVLSEKEREKARRALEEMLEYVELFRDADTEDVLPLYDLFDNGNVYREDRPVQGQGEAELLQNAPSLQDGMCVVPRTFGSDSEQDDA